MSAERLSEIIEKIAPEVYIFDTRTFKFLLVNELARESLGLTREELAQLRPWDLTPQFSEDRFKRFVHPLVVGTVDVLIVETVQQRKDGTQYDARVRLQKVENREGAVLFATITDISKEARIRRKADAALLTSNRIFKQAEKVAKVGSWEYDIKANDLRWSDETYHISGLTPGVSVDMEAAIGLYAPEDQPIINDALNSLIIDQGSTTIEASYLAADGKRKRVRVVGEFLEADVDNDERIVGTIHDITESYEAHLALETAANFDNLTKLFNRYAFDAQLTERIENQLKTREDFYVLLFDLDGFKNINDTFGHVVGDLVLREIGARIDAAAPEQAIVSRWGGDEFAVITQPGTSAELAAMLGEKLIQEINRSIDADGNMVGVSATCGIAKAGEIPDAQDLMRRADLALYHGKSREPGRVHFYRVALEEPSKKRRKAMALVREALDEDRIEVGYQPIVKLSTNNVVGLEALMRVRTKNENLLTAFEVLPAIKDPVISRQISERMFDLACSDFRKIADTKQIKFISLNATEADLIDREFTVRYQNCLKKFGLKARNLVIEITETMLMVNDNHSMSKVLSKLHRQGLKIALDDFGTGFSSLSHLRDFPIDKVKIDKSFISKICKGGQSQKIVEALIVMAKNLSIDVIAEGVESAEQRDLLCKLGCDYAQGYLFGQAMPAERVLSLDFEKLPH